MNYFIPRTYCRTESKTRLFVQHRDALHQTNRVKLIELNREWIRVFLWCIKCVQLKHHVIHIALLGPGYSLRYTFRSFFLQAAQNISEYGQRLDRLCRDIANLCPDSASRRDLLAYLQRVTLHCHQLNITSRVKAGVQVENSAALIQAARNLMTAVVLTVKESYIASTKYRDPAGQNRPVVRWRMRAPAKKPLITPDTDWDELGPELNDDHEEDEDDNLIRSSRSRSVRRSDALSELAEFDHPLTPVPRYGVR
ncbi:unnamed protein product [Echinostoma caproni]|uniref:Uncharacterized protein n=1 Tax=Echinostoma caproni TaxID=27848 RepID=A0A3P8I0B2_9TREM|nr:unnamed protein product [Echinostoma caproni]